MQKIFLTLIMFVFLFGHSQTKKNTSNNSLVVLELFTSQGCSSCPPADVLVDKVKNEFGEKVISLSYHVDYWNYIGWKDPFSKSEFSDKQRAYSSKFYSSSIYTPQVVINGKEHFVGSNKSTMYSKLKNYFKKPVSNNIAISDINAENNTINFQYDIKGDIADKRLRLALVIKERTTIVKRGENRNRTLKNTNIVIEERYVTLKEVKGLSSISIPELATKTDKLSLVVLIENDNLDIIGGTQVFL